MFSKQNDKSNSETQEAYLGRRADKKLQELILLFWSKGSLLFRNSSISKIKWKKTLLTAFNKTLQKSLINNNVILRPYQYQNRKNSATKYVL